MEESKVQILCFLFPFINGVGRLIWGPLTDIYSFKILGKIIFILQTASSIILFLFWNSFFLFFFILVGAGCLSGLMGTMPGVFTKIFGRKVGVELYGIGMSAVGASSLIAAILVNLNIQICNIYFIGSLLTILGFIVFYFFDDNPIVDDNKIGTGENEEMKEPLLLKKELKINI